MLGAPRWGMGLLLEAASQRPGSCSLLPIPSLLVKSAIQTPTARSTKLLTCSDRDGPVWLTPPPHRSVVTDSGYITFEFSFYG